MKRRTLLYLTGLLAIAAICITIFQDVYITYIQSPCLFSVQGKNFLVSPQCLLEGKLPKLSLQEVVDEIWPQVKGFKNIYLPHTSKFVYEGTSLIFGENSPPLLPQTQKEKDDLREAAIQHKTILITRKQLAHYYLTTFSFYVADKDISQLKPCTKQNYITAFSSLNKKTLPPNASLNLNAALQSLNGYCRGQTDTDLMFYGGVCGVSSQLFRVSLLHPSIEVLQRSAHNERFTVYYGDTVEGDDAAMIQMRKQFEIKNTSDAAIYFRTKQIGQTTYLVAISPYKITNFVAISKQWNGPLSVQLSKKIYKKEWKTMFPSQSPFIKSGYTNEKFSRNLIETITFDSRYRGKNKEAR